MFIVKMKLLGYMVKIVLHCVMFITMVIYLELRLKVFLKVLLHIYFVGISSIFTSRYWLKNFGQRGILISPIGQK